MQPPSPAPTERDAFLVALTGDVDIARKSELAGLVSEFRRSGAADVDIDLTAVEFMDSTGVGAIFALRRLAVERGGDVRIAHPSRAVRRVLDVSGVSGLCEIVD